jgi:hypothetical protein
MPALEAEKLILSARVTVPDAVFERHSPYCPADIGRQLAEQVDTCARGDQLGYYPALDYCQDRGLLDEQLLAVLDQLTWLGTSLVRDEIRLRLRPLFASVQVQSMQALAYTMPQVRPSQPNAFEALVEHLTPNQAKFDVLVTVFRKRGGGDDVERYVDRVAYRHLQQAFDKIQIVNVTKLDQAGS